MQTKKPESTKSRQITQLELKNLKQRFQTMNKLKGGSQGDF